MAIQVSVEKDSLLLKLDLPELREKDASECIGAVLGHPASPVVIFDFATVRAAESGAIRQLLKFVQDLEAKKSRLMILVSRELAQILESKEAGDLSTCYVQVSGAEAATGLPAGSPELGDFLKALGEAVRVTLDTIGNVSCTAEKPGGRGSAKVPTPDLGGTVGIVSDTFRGTLSLGFPLATYLGLMSHLRDKTYTDLDPEIWDWAAELLNVTMGQIKAAFASQGGGITYAIPIPVPGAVLESIHLRAAKSHVIPLACDFGKFYLEFCQSP